MSTILFAWELGAGMGHLAPHRELLRLLIERGHSLHVVSRDLARAGRAFEGLELRYWQTPLSQQSPEVVYHPTISSAHILHNVGFADVSDISVRIAAWRNVLVAIRPHLVLADYSPTALLALRGSGIRAVTMGMGFCLPPRQSALPAFSTLAERVTVEQLAEDESRVVRTINAALQQHHLPPVTSLAEVFHAADLHVLNTVRELDHYPERGPVEYAGLPPERSGVRVFWPMGTRRRIFAYLKPFVALDSLLELLNKLELPSIVACDGLTSESRRKWASATMTFAPPNVDLAQMARECHLAITNGNHTTTARLLLAGKPVMVIPLHLEQELIAAAVQRLGAGVVVRPHEPQDVYRQLAELLNQKNFHSAAAAFAEKYRGLGTASSLERLADRLTALAGA